MTYGIEVYLRWKILIVNLDFQEFMNKKKGLRSGGEE